MIRNGTETDISYDMDANMAVETTHWYPINFGFELHFGIMCSRLTRQNGMNAGIANDEAIGVELGPETQGI